MIRQPKQPSRTAMLVIPLALLAALAGGCGSSGGASSSSTSALRVTTSAPSLAPVKGAYSPAIDPANFVTTIDNRYFPLKPGTAFHYKGLAENGKTPQTDNEVVTDKTKMILGVRCTVVRDTVSSGGHPIERTFDFYAEDTSGNVWYMGEDARDLHNGRFVKAKDSWQSGVNGAEPGIIMPGSPQQGDTYRQEYYPGHAMDQSRVIGSGRHVKVPAGSYKNALFTEETAPSVDPGVAERKWNVAGIGVVREKVVSGNHERLWLVSVTHHSPSTSAQAANPAPLNGGSYAAQIRPADFVSKVDNPYLPFTPGTRFRYQGVMKNGTTPQTDTELVLHRKKRILGVDCTVVRDTVTSSGRPVERTLDWYAQDRQGNVWYMGEETQELKHGQFGKMIDSGPAGRNGAQPGIAMEANPKPGDGYWQFHWPGHALDKGRVPGSGGPMKVPYRSFSHTLVTQEQSPLEPGVRDRKWSVPGIGYIREHAVAGDKEQIRLVSVTP